MRARAFAGLLAGLLLAGTAIVVPSALAKAGDVVVGEDGGSATVVRIHPNGTPSGHQTIEATGAPLVNPGGGDFAPNGLLYVSDYGLTGIVKVNPANGNFSTV